MQASTMNHLQTGSGATAAIGLLSSRVLVGLIFALAGWHKIGGYAGTQGYMDAMGVPGVLLPLVIALELGAGMALIIGFQTRLAALGLAVFTLAASFIFHADFADQMQSLLFMKNIAITGGLLAIAVVGAGAWSVDQRRSH